MKKNIEIIGQRVVLSNSLIHYFYSHADLTSNGIECLHEIDPKSKFEQLLIEKIIFHLQDDFTRSLEPLSLAQQDLLMNKFTELEIDDWWNLLSSQLQN